MRKVVLQMMTTLNGRVDDPAAWMDVEAIGEALYAQIDRVYGTYDTVLVGQTTYEEMYGYWPGAETEEAGSEINKRMAHKMNTYKKYVFSSGRDEKPLEWNNSERVVVRGDADIVRFVADLKAQPGRDITLAGGAQLARSMVRLGLVDEYHLYVHPAVSPGTRWFDDVETKRDLELLSATAYEGGVLGLYYRPRVSK
jgi:dihydrofolate reductase